jgi:hypothetical protein
MWPRGLLRCGGGGEFFGQGFQVKVQRKNEKQEVTLLGSEGERGKQE